MVGGCLLYQITMHISATMDAAIVARTRTPNNTYQPPILPS
jgi:hypothetical protein